jgi:predicted transcriptional regulator
MLRCNLGPTALQILEAVMLEPWLSPTVRDLARITGKSLYCVQFHLQRLRRAGLVTWEDGLARTMVANCRFIPAAELAAAA